jgi:hypothetical protein
MLLVTVLALTAAMFNARAAMIQQESIHAVLGSVGAIDAVGLARRLPRLARQPRWIWGWFVDLLGTISQAAALGFGSVALVQPMLTTELLFILLFVSLRRGTLPETKAWLGAGGITGGLVLLLLIQGDTLSGQADRPKVLTAAAAATVLVTALVVLSRRVRNGAILSAVAAGLCTAMSAVFTKLTVEDLTTVGILGTARDWPGYLLVLATFAGFLTVQAGYSHGPLTWAVAAGLIADPFASYWVGVLAFDVSVPTDAASLVGAAFAGVLLVGGIIALAHHPAVAEQLGATRFSLRRGKHP